MSYITLDGVKGVELKTPLSLDDVKKLKAGDNVYISGQIFGMSDRHFIRVVEEGKKLPIDTTQVNIMAIGGIPQKVGDKYVIINYGDRNFPIVTTGMRYEKWVPEMIRRYNIRVVVAKEGMSDHKATIEACKDTGCITICHYMFPPKGRGVQTFKRVVETHWTDTPTPVIVSEVEKAGPYIVNIDTKGNSMYKEMFGEIDKRLAKVYEKRGLTGFKYIDLE